MRRIIQISAVQESGSNAGGIYALCEDGSLWWQTIGSDEWSKISSIPAE